MELLLSEEQKLLQDSAETFVERNAGPERVRELRGAEACFDRDLWGEMAGAGWLGIITPGEVGGLGLGMTELCLILEQGGTGLMMEPLCAGASAARAIGEGEGAETLQALLASVIDGTRVVLPAIYEKSFAADPADAGTDAAADGKGFRLSGTKSFIPAATGADGSLVNARGPSGGLLCHVAAEAKGVEVQSLSNLDGGGTASLVLDEVTVGEEAVIAGPNRAPQIIARMNDRLLLGTGAELAGVMSKALDITLEYLKMREQFDRPIGSFQALQHRAVNEFINVELVRSFVFQVANAEDTGRASPELAAAVKAKSAGAALSLTKSAIQLHGGIGYTDEHDIGLYFKRAIALAAQYGNQAQQRARYARLSGLSPA